MAKKLAYILVGDHLGQVKKVLYESGEITLLDGCASPSSSNPVVSIEAIEDQNKQLIANKSGEIYLHDSIRGSTKEYRSATKEALIKAIPFAQKKVFLVYDKQVSLAEKNGEFIKQKKGQIRNAKVHDNGLAIVGQDIPLRLYDISTSNKIFEADPPEKDWLGISPDCYVSGLDYVGKTRIVTCSKSDSVIRVYDTKGKSKPVISAKIDQVAFNEHADSARFISVASNGDYGHSVVVGSNVGQMLAIDFRFNVKQLPRKKLQPKNHKVLGGFKGARGGSIKDVKIVPDFSGSTGTEMDTDGDDESESEQDDYERRNRTPGGPKVISCCLDRYLRIHNFTNRALDKHIYMNTKPQCCLPVFYPE